MFETVFKYFTGELDAYPKHKRRIIGAMSYLTVVTALVIALFLGNIMVHILRGKDVVFDGYLSIQDGKIIVGNLPKEPISKKLESLNNFKESLKANIYTNLFETGYRSKELCNKEVDSLLAGLSLKFPDKNDKRGWGYFGSEDSDVGMLVLRCVTIGSSQQILAVTQSPSENSSSRMIDAVWKYYSEKVPVEKRDKFAGHSNDLATRSDWFEIYDNTGQTGQSCSERLPLVFEALKLRTFAATTRYIGFTDDKASGWVYCLPTTIGSNLVHISVVSFDDAYAIALRTRILPALKEEFGDNILSGLPKVDLEYAEVDIPGLSLLKCQERANEAIRSYGLNAEFKNGTLLG